MNPFAALSTIASELACLCSNIERVWRGLALLVTRLERIDGRLDRLERYARAKLPDYPAE